MLKRGQITVFIAIGMILLFLVIITLSFKGEKARLDTEFKTGTESIDAKNYISNCLERSSEKVIWEIGLIGGYKAPISTINYNNEKIPVYNPIPDIKEIESSIAKDISIEFEKCVDIEIIKELGFTLSINPNKTTDVSISKNNIIIESKSPVTIQKQDSSTKPNFLVTVPVRLGEIYENSVKLVKKAKANKPYNITPDCYLYDTNKQTNINIIDKGSGEIIKFIDYSTFNTNYLKSYVFMFGLKNINIQGECIG